MNNEVLDVVSSVLKMTREDAEKNSKPIPELEATYFWNPTRGGGAMIINTKGEKLIAGSSINFDMHKKAFIEGKRN